MKNGREEERGEREAEREGRGGERDRSDHTAKRILK